MASPTSVLRRARGLAALTDELMQSIERLPTADTGREEIVTDAEAEDLWAFHLALSDGVSEADIRQRDPDLYQRLQSRYLTQAEMTRDRLNQLPYR